MKTKICPKCGDEHPVSATYCGCGHKWGGSSRDYAASSGPVDPMYGCCDWTSDGQRCHYPGTHSDSTQGGGPWYCAGHAKCTDGKLGHDIVEQSRRDLPQPDYSLAARRRYFEAGTSKIGVKYRWIPAEDLRAMAREKFVELRNRSKVAA